MTPSRPAGLTAALAFVLCAATAAFAAGGVEVPGIARRVNGQADVPVGLFGVHHFTGLNARTMDEWGITMDRRIFWSANDTPAVPPAGLKMYIECWYDRYQPALVLTRKDWKDYLEKAARTYGENARKSPWKDHIVEFWNEPYLNWATNPGVNYDGRFYDPSNVKAGAPMTIAGWDKPLEHLVWDGPRKLAMRNGQVDYVRTRYMPKDLKVGDTWKDGRREYTVVERWWGKDPTQKHYWSGRQNVQFYLWMFKPFAKTLKETNPDVTVLGGWGFNIFNERWDSWRYLYKPLIDECWQWMDGVHEHHYGGDTRAVAASYEVVYAYTLGTYGKKLRFYNTEAGGSLDPEQPVARPVYHGDDLSRLRGGMTYTLRDIIHLVDVCPDKAASRATHLPSRQGERFAYLLLRDLRGRLMVANSDQPNVWAVSSLQGDTLSLVLFNDGNDAATVPVMVAAPGTATLRGGVRKWVITEEGKLALKTEPVAAEGKALRTRETIAPRSGLALTLQLSIAPDVEALPVRDETQFVQPQILQVVSPGKPVELTIGVDADRLADATGAFVRLVREGLNPSQVKATLNGRPLKIPGGNHTVDIPVPVSWLKADNVLRFEAAAGQATISTASLFILKQAKTE